jgi:L-2-hydroxyglutarate oxidase LhgO
MLKKISTDFLVIGAGIVGLSIAREIKLRNSNYSVTIIEKERKVGVHSSGRNSGVLHSGIYYDSGTLKAKVCSQGAVEMADYHKEHNIKINQLGKILVTTCLQDASQLDILQKRAEQNGVYAERIDNKTLNEIEPEAFSYTGESLWIPSTSVGSPIDTINAMYQEVSNMGVNILCNEEIYNINANMKNLALASGLSINYGHVVNAAGLHADTIAHYFHVGSNYTLLPFKGMYWELDPKSGIKINHLIYPVPDLRVPFLGIHTTTTTDGKTYLGPTSFPAFSRENYHGIDNIEVSDMIRILGLLGMQIIRNKDGFRRLVRKEGSQYLKSQFVSAARLILPRLRKEHLLSTNKVGIRAQMLNKHSGKLVNDFLVESGYCSTHVLNAISPAWTSAFPFARHVYENYIEK